MSKKIETLVNKILSEVKNPPMKLTFNNSQVVHSLLNYDEAYYFILLFSVLRLVLKFLLVVAMKQHSLVFKTISSCM